MNIEKWASALRDAANELAALYGGPVYLVGGALKGSDGDRDIRLLLTRERGEEMWGEWSHDAGTPSVAWLARKRDELKQSRRLCRLTRTHVDFQFCTVLFSYDDGSPILDDRQRLRLDGLPWEFFTAGTVWG